MSCEPPTTWPLPIRIHSLGAFLGFLFSRSFELNLLIETGRSRRTRTRVCAPHSGGIETTFPLEAVAPQQFLSHAYRKFTPRFSLRLLNALTGPGIPRFRPGHRLQ
jgi:hypothetical protein